MEPLLEVSNLTVTFRSDDGPVLAVEDFSLSLVQGQTAGLVGESGSGKSTVAMAIMGLLPASAQLHGSIRFAGKELLGRSESELRTIRGKDIAMVFQDALSALNPVLRVGAQLMEAISVHDRAATASQLRRRAVELLEMVGIPSPAERAELYPHELSGGMRQRVLIAMSVANEPRILIADEPTTALDVTVQAQILEVLGRVRERLDSSMLLVTHDLGVVAGTADSVVVMYAGVKVEEGPVDQLFYGNAHPYTRGLLASLPRADRRASRSERLYRIPGQLPGTRDRPTGCVFHPRCPEARPGECFPARPPLVDLGDDHRAACARIHEIGSNR